MQLADDERPHRRWAGKRDPNKRVEISNFLASPEAAGFGDREVARRFGVGHQLVGQIRAELDHTGRPGVDDSTGGDRGTSTLNHPPGRLPPSPADRPRKLDQRRVQAFLDQIEDVPLGVMPDIPAFLDRRTAP